MSSFCLGCEHTACIGISCPRFCCRSIDRDTANPRMEFNVSVMSDNPRPYGTANEIPSQQCVIAETLRLALNALMPSATARLRRDAKRAIRRMLAQFEKEQIPEEVTG